MNGIDDRDRVAVCIDTCHIFAAGYDISTEQGYLETFSELDAIIGLSNVRLFHLNDSKRECGSRVDRHEHIGQGQIGETPFRMLMSDKRFNQVPMVIETPKSADMHEDVENLNLLRSWIPIDESTGK
jgi:deoxyribonuclease-4